MKKRIFVILISLNMLFFINPVFAQDILFNGRKNKIGFMTGNGIQYLGQVTGGNNHSIALKTTYYYRVTFYQLQYYLALSRKKASGFDLLVQPQYNTTKYKLYDNDENYLKGYELG